MEDEAKLFVVAETEPELPLDNVVPMPRRQVERINGIRINLGAMSLVELDVLVASIEDRFQEVHCDLMIVRDVRDRRQREGQL